MKLSKILVIVLIGLWLSACAHTGSPDPVKPKKEKPPDNTSESQIPPPETSKSEPKESSKNTQTTQQPPRDETRSDQLEDREKQQTSQSPPADSADARLEEARQKLQTSRETEEQIASELDQLKKSGNASAEAIKDYDEYLARVRAMTAENQKIVEQMQSAYTRHSAAKKRPNQAASNSLDKDYDPSIPEEQTVDEVAALDRELNESLAKFDDRLLNEMEAIRTGSEKKLQDLAQEAADAAKRLRDKGVAADTSTETETQNEASGNGQDAQKTEGGEEVKTASRDRSQKGGTGSAVNDRRRADYEDDDIVARQLREAAENEPDPELKEKLWKEYEEYKKSR